MEEQEIDYAEPRGMTFDFRGFLFKALNLWKLVFLCIGAALIVAYWINVRKQNIYKLESLISVESEQNPFFTANTSISFNWGGVSGKVGKIMTSIKTRSHNEKVVDSLQFYMNYLVQGKYRMEDIYKNAPFVVTLDKTKGELLGKPIGIRFISETKFELFTEFTGTVANLQRPIDKVKYSVKVPQGAFTATYSLGQTINLPFFNATITLRPDKVIVPQSEYYVQFLNFDSVVGAYQSGINISPFSKESSSVLKLSLAGNNKAKIVDYLNATASILSLTELERKNLYATNTIKFIDSSLAAVNDNLKDVTDEMNTFRKKNKVFDVSDEMQQISEKLKELDVSKEAEQTKLNYLNALENYLRTKTDYTKIAAPTSVGIEEANIVSGVSKITALAIERQNLEYTTKEGSILFKDIDKQIDAEKNVLLETLDATKNITRIQMNTISKTIANLEAQLSSLPEDQQKYLKIERKMNISQQAYDVYLAKRGEAAIVKAANVSDISVIDEAKDIGGGLIGPNKSLNYMMALMVGFFAPMFLIFVIFLLDSTIHGSDEVERLSSIPILGLIGKYNYKNNLVVFEKPKSAVAESFRAIRSSLQFIYKKQGKDENGLGRTIMLTSSVSGEGKTFCSINIATVYALSGKKTLLLGMDLRKPKIFDDFGITNEKGIVNYLIGESSFEEVKYVSHIENLDVVLSGPVPPNPS
ncbi:MAG: sugar transporter, partial [Gelidibacter sp.]|nr:sugar transporter [Gelidibacter sp.]